MSINLGLPEMEGLKPKIAVIGVGGAGGNAIANMIAATVEGVEFLVANTDAQALNASSAERRLQLGVQITQGLGAGSRPEVGRAAAEESIAELESVLDGMHMVFIAAGMGGGTGTGAAPVIAKAARDKGILTVGVVTKPFSFEGTRRMRSADAGIEELEKHVDTLIVIPNQNLFMVAEAKTTFIEAFRMADEVLQQGVRGITDLMVMPGLVNLDFADVKSVMRDAGKAMMGTGEAEGEGRALAAAQMAIANPLLDGVSMAGAKGVIISISGGEDLGLFELQEAGDHIRDLVDPDANIIWGSAFNPNLNGKIRVSVVATGLDMEASSGTVQRAAQNIPFARPAASTLAPPPLSASVPPAAPISPEPSLTPPTSAPSISSAPSFGGAAGLGAAASSLSEPTPPAPSASTPTPPEPSLSTPQLDVNAAGPNDTDELVLDSGAVAAEAQADTPRPIPVYSDDDDLFPTAAPAPSPAAQTAESAPAAGGQTLFERMKALSRMEASKGGSAAPQTPQSPTAGLGGDDDGDDDGRFPAIPRFLGRQSNQ
jgi:cell division protein FtsZ